MTPQQRQQLIEFLDNAMLFLWGVTFLLFPFVVSTLTTESFILPKEIFVSIVVLLSLLLFVVKTVVNQRLHFRRTPFDVPIALFAFALLLSSLIAVNRFDSLIAFVPVLLAIVGYYSIVNALKKESATVFALSALVVSGAAVAVVAVFSYLKVYPIPFPFTHQQAFTTLGSLLEQALFLTAIFPIALQMALHIFKGDTKGKTVGAAACTLLIGAGLLVTIAQLVTTQKPTILPFETGFQTAFAAISQDTGRVAQGFFFGSGYGNYESVFTRFKQASFNTNATLWYLPFSQSSSFVLELLATTGFIGMLSFLFILFRALIHPKNKKVNPLYFSVVLLAIAACILPFSFEGIALLFFVLGLFASAEAVKHPSNFFDIEPRFVALKKGLILLDHASVSTNERYEYNKVMPFGAGVIILIFVGVVGLYAGRFVLSNMYFQQSLVAANNNNGSLTYRDQALAINTFPYQNVYDRIFSQTNIALANSIAATQPKGASPSSQVQSTVYTLIQQAITTSRNATTLSPLTVENWQNLSSVYRSLISVGQNADTFAIQAAQQAVVLDPTNPQEFISLGGLYYQLGQYDNAISTFQQAIQLKQDYANAYYNLGHAYIQKQDIKDAVAALQIVAQLTANDKTNHDKVMVEINSLQQPQTAPVANATPTPPVPTKAPAATVQQPLSVNQTSPIPAQTSPIPLVSPTATPTPGK